MRQKISDGHTNNSNLFDLKHDPGGIVDVEFIVQYTVLAHASQHGELAKNLGNIGLLLRASELALIPEELARQTADAYRSFRSAQHAMRLQGMDKVKGIPEEYSSQRQAVLELWRIIFADGRGL